MQDGFDETKIVDEAFEDLLQYCNCSKNKDSESLIRKAFLFANNAHKGVKRKSGEPYILHPIAVAKIVAKEIGLGTKSICAGLLHDVVEDTHFTLEDIESAFGAKIAYLVDGLTKISGIFSSDVSRQAENLKKILLTLSDDMRVILVKLADRLHNMRTLEHMPAHKQMKIASETLYIFAPLAHRLGLKSVCEELEALSLRYLNPQEYQEIENKLSETKDKFDSILQNFMRPIQEKMEKEGYSFEIIGRQKSVFSTWRKMQRKQICFEDVYDLLAVRIIFNPKEEKSEKIQCFEIYNIIAELYRLKEDRTRDWINHPRPTGYEALHLTAMSESGNWVEVQIRSKRMNDVAERGVAAHWNYKEGGGDFSELDKWLTEIQVLFEDADSDALSFLDDFKLSLYYDDIQIYTPKGDVHTLPKGAKVLDFAYKIHTDLGEKCIGAKVNRRTRPLDYVLHSGEQVEILTSEKQKPKEEWIDMVITPRAKSKLKSMFRAERQKKVEQGEEILTEIFKRNKFGALNNETLNKLLTNLNILQKEKFYMSLTDGILGEKEIKKAFLKSDSFSFIPYTTLKFPNLFKRKKNVESVEKQKVEQPRKLKNKTIALRDDSVDEQYHIATCCSPIPGDEVIGFVDFKGRVDVHKRSCPRILRISARHGDRLISANWETKNIKSFLAKIRIEGVDRHGLLNEITGLISNDYGVNMTELTVKTISGIFHSEIEMYVPNAKELNDVMYKIGSISGITSVYRKENKTEIE
ncbi:MAG: bifunctional (p)ppGpp synthetase/guanosine-3',5'-bis(diphosphate) 3'-pyrophosphohydrolase [Flavobacteriaceae bacterium]|nr:bifunctional (p)ppGpp synthetase/guanosine-3',5'-bis(diphosphate) 3'-pyrophosphohydrolase [Flavobacteriaceae bacterium]